MELARRYMPKLDEINYARPITMPTVDADIKPLNSKPRVCECCGAPIHGYVCEYCGVEYVNQSDTTVCLDGNAVAKAMQKNALELLYRAHGMDIDGAERVAGFFRGADGKAVVIA